MADQALPVRPKPRDYLCLTDPASANVDYASSPGLDFSRLSGSFPSST